MDTTTKVYLIFFFLGLIYAIIAGIFSHVLDLGGDHDLGDIGGGVDTADLSGAGMPTFSPINSVTLATFVTTFGAAGLIWNYFKPGTAGWFPGLFVAFLAAFLVAIAVFYLFYKVFSVTQSSSEARVADLPGSIAEVTAPIPENGIGEIAYIQKGTRLNAPAKSEDGRPIPAHASVTITRVSGSVLIVAPVKSPEASS
jgi:membrane protein implicated in regulation of membrane protease activity